MLELDRCVVLDLEQAHAPAALLGVVFRTEAPSAEIDDRRGLVRLRLRDERIGDDLAVRILLRLQRREPSTELRELRDAPRVALLRGLDVDRLDLGRGRR